PRRRDRRRRRRRDHARQARRRQPPPGRSLAARSAAPARVRPRPRRGRAVAGGRRGCAVSTVRIVTDSAAALPPALVERHGIRVVPLWLAIGDERHRDGEVPLDEVVRRFDEPITTSAPAPGEFATAITEALAGGPVVVLTIAAAMSSTHESAVLAAKLVGEGAGDGGDQQVAVVDTGTAAGAQ